MLKPLVFLPAVFALAFAVVVWRGRSVVCLQTLVLTIAMALFAAGWGWLTYIGAPHWVRWTLVLAPAPVLIAQHIHLRRIKAEARRLRANLATVQAALVALDRAVVSAPSEDDPKT